MSTRGSRGLRAESSAHARNRSPTADGLMSITIELLQTLHVGDVLWPTGRELHRDEPVTRYDADVASAGPDGLARLPDRREGPRCFDDVQHERLRIDHL